MLRQHFLGTTWSNQVPGSSIALSDMEEFPCLDFPCSSSRRDKVGQIVAWTPSTLHSFPVGLCCKENVLGNIGGGCSFCAQCLCLLRQTGMQENPCSEVPKPAPVLALQGVVPKALEHGQEGSWGTPWHGAGARTVRMSIPGALHTPLSSIPAGPPSVGKVSPFNAVSPSHSSLRALAASGMCLEQFTIDVAFCLASFSSGKKFGFTMFSGKNIWRWTF